MPAAEATPYGNFAQPVPGATITVPHNNSDTQSRCTLGPYVSIGDGRIGALTAGHCGADGDEVDWNGRKVGMLYHPVYVKDANGVTLRDFAVIIPTVSAPFNNPDIMASKPVASFYTTQELSQLLAAGQPVNVCTYGATTGLRCGALTGSSTSTEKVIAHFPSDHGDSGGPVWIDTPTGTWVVGILTAVPNSDPSSSIVVPIEDPATTYQVKVTVHRA
ncbi:hypothetical protein [Segniliparus rotundus]|uniref:hypothetical protein n=1 Tax=Segniliparus rotundus TaxID=286802 RepID=UPI0011D14F23|nr:hypothetical protein [Segniliparus rotundus]